MANAHKRYNLDDIMKKTDEWMICLRKGEYTPAKLAELDALPTDNFRKVVDHQEFEVLKMIIPNIIKQRRELFHCMARKFSELSADDRHDMIHAIGAKFRRDGVTNEEKIICKQLLECLVPTKTKKAA